MIPLKKTISASFQMLERLAGGRNPLNSLVYGCDDLSDPDSFLDYHNDLTNADGTESTTDCHDNSFQFPNEGLEISDFVTQDFVSDASSRNQNRKSDNNGDEKEYEINKYDPCGFCMTPAEELPKRAQGIGAENVLSEEKNSSGSDISWRKKPRPQIVECKDFCDKCSLYLTRYHSDKVIPLPSSVSVNVASSECYFCVLRTVGDLKQRISKTNKFLEQMETTIRKRRKSNTFEDSSKQLNPIPLKALSDIQSKVLSDKETIDCSTTHDNLNPECSVCFRKHGDHDDDVMFSSYGVLPDCQHSFCNRCISSWLQQSAIDRWRCPVCRTPVLFTFVSKLWLPHNTDGKTRQLSSTRYRLLLTRMMLKKATALLRVLLFYWTVGVKALRNIIDEIYPELEPLLHRHEIGAFV